MRYWLLIWPHVFVTAGVPWQAGAEPCELECAVAQSPVAPPWKLNGISLPEPSLMMYDATPRFQHIGISRPPQVPATPSVGPSVANERLNSASMRKYFVPATGVLPGFGYALATTIRMRVVA